MADIVWDEVGERRYETGVDHGVLHHPIAGSIPWNGLVSVTDDNTKGVNPFYQDGVKFLNQQVHGSYSGKLRALTYPDELDYLLGTVEPHPGARVHDQVLRPFHLSYRTKIGNDLDADHGYKIHVIYNVTAVPSGTTIDTISNDVSPTPFEWDLLGLPVRFADHRPTSHISFDSTRIDGAKLAAIETAIYEAGSDIPDLTDLLDLAA